MGLMMRQWTDDTFVMFPDPARYLSSISIWPICAYLRPESHPPGIGIAHEAVNLACFLVYKRNNVRRKSRNFKGKSRGVGVGGFFGSGVGWGWRLRTEARIRSRGVPALPWGQLNVTYSKYIPTLWQHSFVNGCRDTTQTVVIGNADLGVSGPIWTTLTWGPPESTANISVMTSHTPPPPAFNSLGSQIPFDVSV